MCRQLVVPSLACLALLAAGCDANLPGKPNPKDRPVPADKVLAFETLYGQNCAGCHGKEGKLGPAPPLNDPLFRAIVSTFALENVLSNGQAGTPMPPFAHDNGGPLTAAQIQVLIYEIQGVRYRIDDKNEALSLPLPRSKVGVEIIPDEKGIVPRWDVVGPAPAGIPPYSLPEASGNAEHGAELFSRACASCHGANGVGRAKDGRQINKINDQVFLSLISDQALRRIIITGRPDLKMPDYAQKTGRPDDFQPLTSSEIADLGALLSSWRAGKALATK
jgi:cytochrome c oxidase cbb3-type subunit III